MENQLSGEIREKKHYLPVRVYYSDTDAGGVVYHSRYLDMAEHGRSDMLRDLGGHQFDLIKKEGIGFVVRSLTVDYIKPAYLDDLLSVETRVTRCEAFTVLFLQRVLRNGECLAELKIKAGSVSLADGRPRPMPKEWKASINDLILSPSKG